MKASDTAGPDPAADPVASPSSACSAGSHPDHAWYRALFDGVDDALFAFGLVDGNPSTLLEINPSACGRYGRSREEFLGLRLADLDTDGEWEAADWSTLQRDGRLCLNRRHYSTTGETFPVEIRCRLVAIDGQSTVIAAVRDVSQQERERSEREELERQLLQAQKLDAVGQLAAGIAHDLNNMLSPILGYGHILESKIPEWDSKRRPLRGIMESGKRACDLTRQMLLFSRRQPMRREPTELPTVVARLRSTLERSANEGISLSYEEGQQCPVEIDVEQMEQVLLNLVVNAIDAMPDGGDLVVATGRCKHQQRAWAHLQVRDTGIGMDQATQDRAFEPFFTTKGSERDTGLGLPTVYGIVRRHGGLVRIDSAPNRGTTVDVLLPPTCSAHASSTPQIRGTGTSLVPRVRRVLVCEDEPMVAEMIRDILITQAWEVEVVHSAEAALECLDKIPLPDAVLTDVMLPGIDGLELAEQTRRRHPGVHIALMSGYHDLMDRAEELGLPILVKPFSLQQLVEAIRPVTDPA